MTHNRVRRFARKAIRDLKGNICASSIVDYIKKNGYNVVFYDEGNGTLADYNMSEYAKGVNAFVMRKGSDKIVFIKKGLSPEIELVSLLHELGHILCRHIENYDFRCGSNWAEAEAYAFAHEVLSRSIIHF